MDVRYIAPFLESVKNILEQFNVTDVKRGMLYKKNSMSVDTDVTAIIGLVGQIRGNVAYTMSENTAKNIISYMMMGMPVNEIDEMSRSAIGEFANMITGNASTLLAANGVITDMTPPSIVYGKNIYFIISSVDTIAMDLNSSVGKIQVNIGLEV